MTIRATPEKTAEQLRAELINGYRKTIVQVIGVIFVVVGAVSGALFTIRQMRIAHEGQITERYAKAITHLGDEKLTIRLGGIYELERIARDSAKDQWTIVETLSAFVRENASAAQPGEGEAGYWLPSMRADVQAALTVLGRRNQIAEPGRVDLERANLAYARLYDAHLPRLAFSGGNLEHAILMSASLEDAQFMMANLKRVNFMLAHLERANLIEAHMEQVSFHSAHLEEAMFQNAHLQGAVFNGAYLRGAFFNGSHLENTTWLDAHLGGAILTEAHLEGANLSKAIGVTAEQLRVAHVDTTTRLPPGIIWADIATT